MDHKNRGKSRGGGGGGGGGGECGTAKPGPMATCIKRPFCDVPKVSA